MVFFLFTWYLRILLLEVGSALIKFIREFRLILMWGIYESSRLRRRDLELVMLHKVHKQLKYQP